jgi:hypothetical protein
METETNFSLAPPIFYGENYHAWAVKMSTYLEALLDLWDAVEEDYEVQPLPANPTVAQMKNHKEMKTRMSKVKACLFSVKYNIYKNNEPKINKRNMGLSRKGIPGK